MHLDEGVDVHELITEIRPLLGRTVVATDFDGTLAPLTPNPEESAPVDGTIAALQQLAARGAQVAVITGRDAETVVRLGGLDAVPGVVVEGLYGLEQWRDGELTSPETPEPIHRLTERLPDVLAGAGAAPEVWIEDKRLSLVVHTRRAADPDAELGKLRGPVERLARELRLEAHPGSQVLEVRIPGYDKAGAVDRLVEEFRPAGLLYLGDDLGDIPAFERVRELRDTGLVAYAVGVLSSGVGPVSAAVDVALPAAADAVAMFRALADESG
jgi:trehalose 6-phosphate phosphatase